MRGTQGFTLIELSIVLVIIGLIVGGILVGQDLIKSAATRAQIAQIEKFQTATNTFRGKYGAIPGDMSLSVANQFGFDPGTACDGVLEGRRNGNGLLAGSVSPFQKTQTEGETQLFWVDLTSAVSGNLIEGQFPGSGAPAITCNSVPGYALTTTPGSAYVGAYIPEAKIGMGNFIYVYANSNYNWFALSNVSGINNGVLSSIADIPVVQAYNIDKKLDDGIPQSGTVITVYLNSGSFWNAGAQPTDQTNSCYNIANGTYSLSSYADYGIHGNCALSFRFQ